MITYVGLVILLAFCTQALCRMCITESEWVAITMAQLCCAVLQLSDGIAKDTQSALPGAWT